MKDNIIYTIGYAPLLPFEEFLKSLKKYGVNCVVDVRIPTYVNAPGFYSKANISQKLKEQGICYLSFMQEFGLVDEDCKRRGKPVYDKIVTSDRFLHGVERLKNGLNKGYSIALLGFYDTPRDCSRYNVIGRYLVNNGWQVYHIIHGGLSRHASVRFIESRLLSQQDMMEYIERQEISQKAKKMLAAKLGRDGEEVAAQYLIDRGFTILDKNWNLHRGCELDIVAFKDNVVHAVEVKTRTSDRIGDPEQAIDERKMKNLAKALGEYLYRNGLKNVGAQIDSVAIVMKGNDDYVLRMHENLIRRAVYKYWK